MIKLLNDRNKIMPKQDFATILENHIRLWDRLGDRLKFTQSDLMGYTRQQLAVLMRLYLGGRAMLKDIARRELMTTANLCLMFKKLEKENLVLRKIDETDRRNTWYTVTKRGAEMAEQCLQKFHDSINNLFMEISDEDESVLINSMLAINDILIKLEEKNA